MEWNILICLKETGWTWIKHAVGIFQLGTGFPGKMLKMSRGVISRLKLVYGYKGPGSENNVYLQLGAFPSLD